VSILFKLIGWLISFLDQAERDQLVDFVTKSGKAVEAVKGAKSDEDRKQAVIDLINSDGSH
jgi:hypothetical protein